jgi:hypothetical protein
MSLEVKLEELKQLHTKGLITAEVYALQQQALLSNTSPIGSTPVRAEASTTAIPSTSDTALTGWIYGFIGLILVVFGCIWLTNKVGDSRTKDAVSELVSQTGIGTQVVPWSQLAEAAVRRLIDVNADSLATSILAITHPTGNTPVLTGKSISKLDDRILVELVITWKGEGARTSPSDDGNLGGKQS